MVNSNINSVFVYGTLKKDRSNHGLLRNYTDEGIKATTVSKFDMCEAGFPIIRPNPEGNKIWGEVYRVDNNTLRSLDGLEGHPNFYCREEYNFFLEDGSQEIAWIYIGVSPQHYFDNWTPSSLNADGLLEF